MPSSMPRCPHCFPEESLVLPSWQITAPDGTPAVPTALTFNVKRISDGMVIGAASRDGFGTGTGTNGVAINPSGYVVHTIGTADTTLSVAGVGELRRVEYLLTFAGGLVREVRLDFYVRVEDF